MLYAFGVGEAAISISGDPGRPDRLVHTVRAVGKVSEALARLRPGQMLGVRGPFGKGWPVEAAVGADVVIIAGGLGLAPLRPALYRLLAERRALRPRRPAVRGARARRTSSSAPRSSAGGALLDLEVAVTVDHAGRDWRGNVGVVTTLIGRRGLRPGPHRRVRLRTGDHDALRRAASCEARGVSAARRSTSRWSAT